MFSLYKVQCSCSTQTHSLINPPYVQHHKPNFELQHLQLWWLLRLICGWSLGFWCELYCKIASLHCEIMKNIANFMQNIDYLTLLLSYIVELQDTAIRGKDSSSSSYIFPSTVPLNIMNYDLPPHILEFVLKINFKANLWHARWT